MSDRGDFKEPNVGDWVLVSNDVDGVVACLRVDDVGYGGEAVTLSDGSAWARETGAPLHRKWRGHSLWQADPVYLAADIDRAMADAPHETLCKVYAVLLADAGKGPIAAAPPENNEPIADDVWPYENVLAYCKVCHKTHGANKGEKMCGGAGSWVPDR